ncbi:hypothetical protein GGS23DRAFT_315501 [Durotheca rogersii]|uniref:uncharacterized protein n=1 Tax=Durotheca rogersii TaxID=419775 RepID=UPI002220B1F8|nr:uncharacterized protein GGS23DRAFT_315501 [Durotheca rogersii]KAI5859618.1 hypothetical protein GGS23DRAFT_315501 [Durotheca rogersii]
MKFLAAVSPLLLGAVSVAAAPVSKPSILNVAKFTAHTQPNGNGATFSFDLHVPDTGRGTSCAYSDDTSVSALPAVTMRPCADPAFEWQFRQDPGRPGAEGRYRLVVTYDYGSPDHARAAGFNEWDVVDFPLETVGSASETYFRGNPDFAINLS